MRSVSVCIHSNPCSPRYPGAQLNVLRMSLCTMLEGLSFVSSIGCRRHPFLPLPLPLAFHSGSSSPRAQRMKPSMNFLGASGMLCECERRLRWIR